jgi:hypothetical protein
MDADKYDQTLLHVAAVLTTACFDNRGADSADVVKKFRQVVDELRKQNMLGTLPS